MHGLYPCYFEIDGKKQELLATQFESHHAREVFPCVDEPAAKPTFDLTITS
jgi:aminopeptidase N